MPVELKWKHQQKTYELMKQELKRTGKAAYVFPTGAGKSFPALKYIEDNPEKKVLIISPNRVINEQFKKYIRQYIPNGERRLKKKDIGIITYYKTMLLKDISKNLKPDIIIFDEIHRMGAEKWEPATDALTQTFPESEVIGMSATPERVDRRNMAYEKFGDSIVYQMSLTEALSGEKEGEKVLSSFRYYKVLSALKEPVEKYREQTEEIEDEEQRKKLVEKCERLSRIIGNSPDISEVMYNAMKEKPNGKYIVFCKDGEDLQERMEDVQRIFGKVNSNINCEYVFSYQGKKDGFGKTRKENRKAIEEFENIKEGDSLNLLFCVDILNEGIHIDGVDGEVLFDLTRSPILYKQRIGRICSAEEGATDRVVIDVAGNWIEQLDVYRELEEAILEGEKRKENSKVKTEKAKRESKQNNIDYDLLKLSVEETELLNIMIELREKLQYRKRITSLESAKGIEEWCERNFGIGENISENKRMPSTISKEEEERRLGMQLVNIKNSICKQYEGMELEEIEREDHREIVRIIRYIEETYMSEKQKKQSTSMKSRITSLESAKGIEEWCERNFGIGENISENKRMPSAISKEEEERRLGIQLVSIKSYICKKYEGMELEEIEREDHREIVRIIRHIDETYMSDEQRNRSNGAKKRMRATVAKNVGANRAIREELEGRTYKMGKCDGNRD